MSHDPNIPKPLPISPVRSATGTVQSPLMSQSLEPSAVDRISGSPLFAAANAGTAEASFVDRFPGAPPPHEPVVNIDPPGGWWAIPFREIWEYRELLYFLVWRDVKVRYKQTVIGVAWAVLQPVLTMAIFWLFLGKLARLPSNGLPYPVFYFSGLVPWSYFAYSLTTTTNTVVGNQVLLTKVYFPRLILPISSVLSGLVDFAIGFVLLLIVTLGYHIVPGPSILWLPALLFLAMCTALGVGLWLSALNALYRDVRYLMGFLVQFWMFASPLLYPSSLVTDHYPRWAWLYGLNPMAGVIDGFRWALTGHGQPPGLLLLASSVSVVIVLVSGMMFFYRMEGTMADLV
jgi:lipopolysaccharide transport system permease protein